MALAEVKTIYPSNMRNMPASLRMLADAIERGDHGKVKAIVFVLRREGVNTCEHIGATEVFGIGEGDFWEHLGILQGGVIKLAGMAE